MADMVVEEARTDIEDVVQLEDGEEVLFLQSDVTFAKSGCDETGEGEVPDVQSQGVGELRVTTKRIIWLPAVRGDTSSQGRFEFHASSMTMHALSREGMGPDFAFPCVYCQLEGFALPKEAHFAPADAGILDTCFRAMAQTALLNPAPDEDELGGGVLGGANFDGFYGEVNEQILPGELGEENDADFEALASVAASSRTVEPTDEERAAMLAHLDSILVVPPHLRAPGDNSGTDRGERTGTMDAGAGQFDDEETDNGDATTGIGGGSPGSRKVPRVDV